MNHVRRSSIQAHAKGASCLDELPVSLLAALIDLRGAKADLEVIRIFDERIPQSLWPKALSEMLRRPAMFPEGVVREAMSLVGFRAVAKELGVMPAGIAFNRFARRAAPL